MSGSEEGSLLAPSQTERSEPDTAQPVAEETTPLLLSENGASVHSYSSGSQNTTSSSGNGSSLARPSKRNSRRWPSIFSILALAIFSLGIIVFAFFVPTAVEEYAKEGIVIEPTNLSLESITTGGVCVRVQATFRLDSSRVKSDYSRHIGRLTTWVIGKIGTEGTTILAFLPDYANELLGSVDVPPLVISVADGEITQVDFVANVSLGDAEGIRSIANLWLDGQLDLLRIQGKATMRLRSGLIPLGTHPVSESLVFEAKELPQIPEYNIDRVIFDEVDDSGSSNKMMLAEVSISAFNRFPIQLVVPSLGFEVLVQNCNYLDPYIVVAEARTGLIDVRPMSVVNVEANGTVQELPDSLTSLCPDSDSSPLDLLLKQYMSGDSAVVFVRGRSSDLDESLGWISDILASVTVPVAFPGRTFDGLIRNFSLTDVHFSLPDPMAEPGEPGASPTVSGTIIVTASLPEEMNFNINVTEVRANADVLYHGNKLGKLDLYNWQTANSTMTRASKKHEATLQIQSRVDNAPINITDSDVLTEVIQELLFAGKEINLDVIALVDIRINTVLGQLELKDVPAAGSIPVKPLSKSLMDSLSPTVSDIKVLDTTKFTLTVEALVNVTNPTEYTAHIPDISIHVLCNETIVAVARAKDLDVFAGNNTNIVMNITWNPLFSGERGSQIGQDLLSEFISGLKPFITLKTHRDSIPLQPVIGEALSKFNFTLQAPQIRLPRSGDDDDGSEEDGDTDEHSFIYDATFHILSSTASFILFSPLMESTLYIEAINATALYNHSEPVGIIITDKPFAAAPGRSMTPRLPVDWYPDSVGFDKLRKALGGDLKLDTKAVVGIRLGSWRETVWYVGQGIGAHIRP